MCIVFSVSSLEKKAMLLRKAVAVCVAPSLLQPAH
jgi:hypothetical protein